VRDLARGRGVIGAVEKMRLRRGRVGWRGKNGVKGVEKGRGNA